jgi:beta-glucanase (GH16 family)
MKGVSRREGASSPAANHAGTVDAPRRKRSGWPGQLALLAGLALVVAVSLPTPTFRDDFDGSSLDGAKWWRETRWDGDRRWQTWCTWSDDPRLYQVSGGILTLSARRVDAATPYICPIISTRGKFEQNHGIWRARMKWDRGHALWPAFWLHNVPNSADEIDILEAYPEPTNPDYYQVSAHWSDGQQTRVENTDADWHIYEVEWRGTRTTFRRDGVTVARISGPIAGSPMFGILNLMVGVHYSGTAPDATTPDSPRLMVDWVEVLP